MINTILLVEDDSNVREGLEKFLKRKGFDVITGSDGKEAWKIVQKEHINLILTDLILPELDGIELLKRVKDLKPQLQVILMSAHGTVERAVEAMKDGAYDFLTKPLDLKRLGMVVEKALEKHHLILEKSELEDKLKNKYKIDNIVGRSNQMHRVLEIVYQIAPRRTTVLIHGETGTGKERVANAIHYYSPRASMPLVKVSCAALSEGVLESELFGHEKGAFTGALVSRSGRFEMADGGTLFLDEVESLTLSTQVKLLRVLQEMEFERVGGNRTIKVDARLIAATNNDLKELVQKGKFREDLYYRLNVANIFLPPLRERMEDVPCLVDHFIQKYNEENDLQIHISRKAMQTFLRYNWPGNVRELKNCLESSLTFVSEGILLPEHLPSSVRQPSQEDQNLVVAPGTPLAEVEKALIRRTLQITGNNRNETAQLLGIGVRTLYRRMAEYGM